MANFTTHIAVGTVVSGALATLTLAADVVAPENLLAVTLAGVLGSILPDIDLRDSRASKMMFSGLAVFFSFAVLFNAAAELSIAELWLLWLGTLVAVRYGIHAVFHRLSRHRGVWHSVLAGVFVSVLTALVFYRLLGRPEGVAWLAAGFMLIGYLTHLVLDEIYSVDIMDTRLKASFGTALKLFDRRNWPASAAMALATGLAIYVSPPTAMFLDGLGSKSVWTGLSQRMLPQDKWFGVFDPGAITFAQSKQAETPDGAAPGLATGSIDRGGLSDQVAPLAPQTTPAGPESNAD